MCASTLLSFHQLYIICQSNNSRFLQSLEGEAYEHHVVKSQVVGDPSELLELQSSFSREIENEILNMHESKEINEAESEIAANAAVKELERIGSAENISLVEDVVIDVFQPINENKDDSASEKDLPKNNDEKDPVAPVKQRNKEVQSSARSKSKKEPIRKQKNDEKPKTIAKTRPIKSPKTQKKNVKTSKAEILKENITRSKSNKTEKKPIAANDKDVKENSFVDSDNQKYVDNCNEEYSGVIIKFDFI